MAKYLSVCFSGLARLLNLQSQGTSYLHAGMAAAESLNEIIAMALIWKVDRLKHEKR